MPTTTTTTTTSTSGSATTTSTVTESRILTRGTHRMSCVVNAGVEKVSSASQGPPDLPIYLGWSHPTLTPRCWLCPAVQVLPMLGFDKILDKGCPLAAIITCEVRSTSSPVLIVHG
jgi:hypothetical protein